MPKEIRVEKYQIFICDACGKREEIRVGAKHGWVSFVESKLDGIRLLEKVQKTPRYESFHIPNKVTIYCCEKLCAKNYLISSIELFMAEISPSHIKPQRGLSNL